MKASGISLIRGPIFQGIFFILITILEFAALELFFGVVFLEYDVILILQNVLIIGAINLFLTGMFHSAKPALLCSVAFFTVAGIANYFVIAFRGYGIVFMDLYAVKTATEVAGSYQYHIDLSFAAALLLDVALFFLCLLLPRRQHAYFHVKYMLLSLLGMAVSVFFFFWISADVVFFRNISSLTWDHNIGIRNYGYVLYFTSNAGKATVAEPDGYSAEKAEEILSRYTQSEEQAQEQSPNIIVIMNESFSDLSVLGTITTTSEVMPFYDSLEENTIKGYAESSVYGGYTANSEFEFLTGCTKAFLPGNPYLQYIDDYLPTLADVIKGQQGYTEAVAMHPYHPSGYNRNTVYPLLGFDRFLSLEDFSQENLVRDYVGDAEDYQKIIELYEAKESGSSLFLFNVTMQNHSPYNDGEYQFDNPVRVTNFEATTSVNQYLSLIRMSDDALKEFIQYFEQEEEPTVILFFGDHQPHLPDSFYQSLMGTLPDFFSQEEVMQKHLIPFFIWANYDIPEQTVERTSLNYLSGMLLQTAGLQMSSYEQYLLDLQEKLPSVSANGYYDADGKLYDWENDAEYEEFLEEYQIVQYYYLFDKENRSDRYFTVE